MELSGQDDVGLLQRPHFHVHSTHKSYGIFEHVSPADRQVHVHQLLQDLGGCTERFGIEERLVEEIPRP